MKKIITVFLLTFLWLGLQAQITQFPFEQGFEESWTAVGTREPAPENWFNVNGASTTQKWERQGRVGNGMTGPGHIYAYNGGYAARVQPSSSEDLNDWLITPVIELPIPIWQPRLRFRVTADKSYHLPGKLKVRLYDIGTGRPFQGRVSDTSFFTITLLEAEIVPNIEKVGWDNVYIYELHEIDLTTYAGKNVQIAFQACSPKYSPGILLDEVVFTTYGSLSPEISDLRTTWVMSENIGVEWDHSNTNKYYISYEDLGGGTIEYDTVETNRYSLSGLTRGHTYRITVQGEGDEIQYRTQVLSIEVKTPCPSIADDQSVDYFYKADFVNDRSCFEIIDNGGRGNSWSYYSSTSHPEDNGYPYFSRDANIHDNADDWFLTPLIDLPEDQVLHLTIQPLGGNETYNPDRFSVWFVPDINDLESSVCLLPLREYSKNISPLKLIIDLTPFNEAIGGRQGRIAIRAQNAGYYGEFLIREIMVTSKPICRPLTFMELSGRTETTVDLSFRNTEASDIEIEYNTVDFAPGNNASGTQKKVLNSVDLGLDYTYQIENLTGGTKYYLYARANCGEGIGYSEWQRFTFRTELVVRDFPYYEPFDVTSGWIYARTVDGFEIGNWSRKDVNDDMGYWVASSDTSAGFHNYSGQKGPRDQWLISPQIEVPNEGLTGKFVFSTATYNSPIGLSVLVSRTPDFSLYDVLVPNTELTTQKKHNPLYFDLSNYKLEKVYVALRVYSTEHPFGLEVHEFSIRNADYPAPFDFRIDGVHGREISLSWSSETSIDNYEVAFCQQPFDPDNMDSYVNIATIGTTSKSMTIPSLIRGSKYYFYVRALDGNGTASIWVGPLGVYIPCGAEPLPFYESFDYWDPSPSNEEGTMGCWRYYNVEYGDRITPDLRIFPEDRTLSLEGGFTPNAIGLGIGVGTWNYDHSAGRRYLISPPLVFPRGDVVISMQASAIGQGSQCSYTVMMSKSGYMIDDFKDTIGSATVVNFGSNYVDFKESVVRSDFKGPIHSGDTVYLAFVFEQGQGLRFDDIVIGSYEYDCSTPSNVTFTEQPNTSNLTIRAEANTQEIEVVYSTLNFNPNFYYDPNNSSLIKEIISVQGSGSGAYGEGELNNMLPGRKYYIYVRGLCGEGRETSWAGPYEQYGSCNGLVENYPYTYSFEEWTNGRIPTTTTCWQSYASVRYKGFTGSAGSAQSGNYSSPTETPRLLAGDQKDEWLVSPRFKVEEQLFLSFDYRASMYFDEKFYVLISEAGPAQSNFGDTLGEVHYSIWEEKGKFYADLSSYIGKNINVAIVHRTENPYTSKSYHSFLSIDNFSIVKNECPVASNVLLGTVTSDNSLPVSWDGDNTGKWRVLYKDDYFIPEGQGHGAKVAETVEGENNIHLPIEKYKRIVFYIGTECSNMMSGPYFAEHCKSIIKEYPYTEDFESWSERHFFYGCWELIDNDNDGYSFHSTDWVKLGNINQGTYPTGKNGSKGAVVFTSGDYAAEFKDNWLISPGFDFNTPQDESTLEPVLSFFYKLDHSSNPEKYRIYIGNSKDINEMVLIDSVEMNSEEGWKKYSVSLSNYITGAGLYLSPVHIGIQDYGSATGGTYRKVLIDDFKVDNYAGCPPPSDISHEIKSCDTVVLRWIDNWGGSDYKIVYNRGNFDIDMGAMGAKTITSSAIEGGYSVVELTGLEPGADYCYYLSAQCWSDKDLWAGPFYFKTTCPTVSDYPYVEEFGWSSYQSTDFGCWNVIDNNNDKVTWQGSPTGSLLGSAHYLSAEWNQLTDIDDWLISPVILIPESPILRYRYRVGINDEQFELLIGKKSEVWQEDGSFDLTKFEVMKTYVITGMTSETGDKNEEIRWDNGDLENGLDFNLYEGEEVYFAIRIYSTVAVEGFNSLSIKRFELTTGNPCVISPSLPVLTDRGTDYLEVSWLPGEDQQEWEVSWSVSGAENYESWTVTSPNYKIEGLSPDAYYDIKVRAICSSEQGMEVGPVKYKTNISCSRPTAGSVYVWRSMNTLEVQLIPDGTYEEYQVRYRKAGETYIGNPQSYSGSEIKFTLEGLTPEQNYEIEIKKVCSIDDISKEQYIYVSTLSVCETPSNIVFEETNSKDVTLSWSGSSDKYYVDYRIQGAVEWTRQSPVSESRIRLTELTPYTYYEVRIQSECDKNHMSDYGTASFRTQATAEYELKLEVNDDLWGEIVRGSGIYAVNTEVEIVALEKSGYEFMNWTDKTTGAILYTEKQAIHKVVADITLVANFLPVCTSPTELVVLVELKDSTHLRWNGNEGLYILEYKKKLEGWESAVSMEVSETETVLKGLSELDTYTWRVVSKCGEDRYSDTVNGPDFSIATVGIGGVEKSKVEIKLHPNPLKVTDELQVSIVGVEGNKVWKLYDINGRQLKSGSEIRNEFSIGLRGLSSGTYILRVEGTRWEASEKIMISK